MTVECVSVFVTCGTQQDAEHIARTLVEEDLAACVNILQACTSVYRWQGTVHAEQECVLLAKTRRNLAERVSKRVVELHPYEVPCVVVIPLAGGSQPFLEWVHRSTGG